MISCAHIPDRGAYSKPDEALLEKESIIQFQQLKRSFEDSLEGKPLKKLLELGCEDISKPKEVAARLKLGVRGIYNLRVRLQRAWRRFAGKQRKAGRVEPLIFANKR